MGQERDAGPGLGQEEEARGGAAARRTEGTHPPCLGWSQSLQYSGGLVDTSGVQAPDTRRSPARSQVGKAAKA